MKTFNRMVDEQGIDPQTGFGPTIWNAWETNWTGTETTEITRQRTRDVGELLEFLSIMLDLDSLEEQLLELSTLMLSKIHSVRQETLV